MRAITGNVQPAIASFGAALAGAAPVEEVAVYEFRFF